MTPKILVSACLLGQPVRYDGRAKTLHHEALRNWQAQGRLIPLCPEIAAGLPTPRPPAEIAPGLSGPDVLEGRGAILEMSGRDVTEPFLEGARRAVELARSHGCRFALLTDGSPSCGSRWIYDGQHTGGRKQGMGVVAAALHKAGVHVFAQDQIAELAACLDQGVSSPDASGSA